MVYASVSAFGFPLCNVFCQVLISKNIGKQFCHFPRLSFVVIVVVVFISQTSFPLHSKQFRITSLICLNTRFIYLVLAESELN